jgi:NitT/TauT family transport system substrate-binding protein
MKSLLQMVRRRAVVAIALCVPGLVFAAPSGALEKTQMTIAMGGKSLYYLPLTIAERLGYFKAEGLDVTIADFAGGSKAAQALLGGSADVAAGSYEYAITLKAKGIDIEGIVLLGRYSGMALAVDKKHASKYKTPKDLKGMTVGLTAPGSSTNMLLNNLLIKNGLRPTDVSVIGVGTTSGAIAAVKQGSIDAIINLDPVISKLERDGDVVVVADARNAEGMKDVYGGAYMAGCLFVNSAFAARNPNSTQALVNAMVRSLRWLRDASPDKVVEVVGPEYYGDDKALYKEALSKNIGSFLHDGSFSLQGAQGTYAVLDAFDPAMKGARIDLSKTYTNRFVQVAAEKYK